MIYLRDQEMEEDKLVSEDTLIQGTPAGAGRGRTSSKEQRQHEGRQKR